jgi:hypothetical protein
MKAYPTAFGLISLVRTTLQDTQNWDLVWVLLVVAASARSLAICVISKA